MSKYDEFLAEDRRLRILELLRDAGSSCNEDVIQTALKMIGHARLSRDDLRADLRWLKARDLIVNEWLDDLQIVMVTRRGIEVAEGIKQIDGIKQPDIGV